MQQITRNNLEKSNSSAHMYTWMGVAMHELNMFLLLAAPPSRYWFCKWRGPGFVHFIKLSCILCTYLQIIILADCTLICLKKLKQLLRNFMDKVILAYFQKNFILKNISWVLHYLKSMTFFSNVFPLLHS